MAKDLIPAEYTYQNLYNASRSPSTVHVKNTKLYRFFRRYLLQRAISVFKWTIPEEWDADYFLYTLYGYGFLAILDTNRYGVIPQQCAPGGFNLYYRPAWVIVTNPLLGTIQKTIDEDCILLKLQPDYGSIIDLVGYYADMMALAAESAGMNFVNVKTSTIFGAESEAQAQAYYKMFDKISEGNPAAVIGKKLLDPEGKPTWFPFTQNAKELYIASDILSDLLKIRAMFDTEIGIPNSNTEKRERMITDEVNSNNAETACLGELWLQTLNKEIKKANAMFPDLNMSVTWRVNPNPETDAEPVEGSETV